MIKSNFLESLKKKTGPIFDAVVKDDVIYLTTATDSIFTISNDLIDGGAAFNSAFISPSKNGIHDVYYLFMHHSLHKLFVVSATGTSFKSISGITKAAVWDERKMRDLTGVEFEGLEDIRPLIFHPEAGVPKTYPFAPKSSKTPIEIPKDYPMEGTNQDGEFEIAVGPVHAGIIEPGHFRFHVIGEHINKLEIRMFFLHRGLENAARNKTLEDGLMIAEQIAGDESVANAVAYCQAAESLAGIAVPERAKYLRMVFLELERIYSHLADLGGMNLDIGSYQTSSRFALLREKMMRLNQETTGSRFLKGGCIIGGFANDMENEKLLKIHSHMTDLRKDFIELNGRVFSSSTFLDRTFLTGALKFDDGMELSMVGPVARASGISCDARVLLPYAAYDSIRIHEIMDKNGDVLSRFYVKAKEVLVSIDIIEGAINKLKTTKGLVLAKTYGAASLKNRIGFGWTEAPRGSCMFMLKTGDDGKIAQFACRTASFRNWRGVEKTIKTVIIPDFPLVNKSFNLAYAGNDL